MKPLKAIQRVWNVLTQGKDTVLVRKGEDVFEQKIEKDKEYLFLESYEGVELYAVFSALVYHDFDDVVAIPKNVILEDVLQTILTDWELVPQTSLNQILLDDSKKKVFSGLKYHLWFSKSRDEFLIVFRGTTRSIGDWWANLRWVTRFIPGFADHYDIVRQGLPRLVEQVQSDYGAQVRITTTGHSLGGGLAQQAAYAASGIGSVYTFNTTPVTGYYEVDKAHRESNSKGLKIIRLFEHGEILAYLRFPLRQLYMLSSENPEIHELRFNLIKGGNFISEHSIKAFANFLFEALHVGKNDSKSTLEKEVDTETET